MQDMKWLKKAFNWTELSCSCKDCLSKSN
jgi:hypothetical protein